MTSHGFGGARAGSEIKEDEIVEIARQISKVPGVIWAHIVDGPRYNIIFEFAHLHKLEKTPEDLLKEIGEINVNGKGIHEPTDIWIIKNRDISFQHGRPQVKKDMDEKEDE